MFKLVVPLVLSLAMVMPANAQGIPWPEFTWRGFNFTHGNAHKNDNAVYNSGIRRTGWGQDMPAGFVNTGDARRVVARTTLPPNPFGALLDIYNRDVGDQGRVGVKVKINGMEIFREIYHKDQATNGRRREINIPEFAYEGEGKLRVVINSMAREASSWWLSATPNCEARRTAPVSPPMQYAKDKKDGKHSSRDRSRSDDNNNNRNRNDHHNGRRNR